MENSAYVPSTGHLNSPALVVFSQAAGGLQDALRIQRPFNPQFAMSEASKELHRPFTSSFGLRHMEAYSGLPAHILNHLQPQFLHPGLSLGSGAFRPLADLKAFPSPSAFAPPKCLKIETNSDSVHHGHGIFSPSEERFLGPSPRTDSCSPASASMSPQPQTTVKEESLDAHMSEDGDAVHGTATDNDSPGIHDDARGFRIGPLFGGGFSGGSGAYAFSVPGLPPAAHALAKTSFLFDHGPRGNSQKRTSSKKRKFRPLQETSLAHPKFETNNDNRSAGQSYSSILKNGRQGCDKNTKNSRSLSRSSNEPSSSDEGTDDTCARVRRIEELYQQSQRQRTWSYAEVNVEDYLKREKNKVTEAGVTEVADHTVKTEENQEPTDSEPLPTGDTYTMAADAFFNHQMISNLYHEMVPKSETNEEQAQDRAAQEKAAQDRAAQDKAAQDRAAQIQLYDDREQQSMIIGMLSNFIDDVPRDEQINTVEVKQEIEEPMMTFSPSVDSQCEQNEVADRVNSEERPIEQSDATEYKNKVMAAEVLVEFQQEANQVPTQQPQASYMESQPYMPPNITTTVNVPDATMRGASTVYAVAPTIQTLPSTSVQATPMRMPGFNYNGHSAPVQSSIRYGRPPLPVQSIQHHVHCPNRSQGYPCPTMMNVAGPSQQPMVYNAPPPLYGVHPPMMQPTGPYNYYVNPNQQYLQPGANHYPPQQYLQPGTNYRLPAPYQQQPPPYCHVPTYDRQYYAPQPQDGHLRAPAINPVRPPAPREQGTARIVDLPFVPYRTDLETRWAPQQGASASRSNNQTQNEDIALNKKKRDPSCCPICGMTISPGELEAHLSQELEVLCKISGTGLAASRKRRQEPGRPPALPGDSGPEGRWETFQRIKSNRQSRLRLKTRKRKVDDGCMICVGRLHRTPEELNMHVEQCRKNSVNDEDETVDVEGDSELEEWAEHQRQTSSGNNTATSTGRDNDNEGDDVIVDGDEPEESSFGPSQYTERDVVIKNGQDKNKKERIQSQVATVNSSGDVEVTMDVIVESDSNVSTSDAAPSSRAQMLEELRNRIRPLNAESAGETATSTETEDYKCLICLEHYKKPVISTVCWHVHCEDCWLHALGSKNICPQCSMITAPTDLRRIFM